ncbi:MAG TPA: MerR family transcriptional regulator [Acidobacteriaceae bacterium]|jgi:DNA-binding transcriptional MerR regulator|nr:MerR family transcriptional regulator [Acidobacteriaceae bacterium]
MSAFRIQEFARLAGVTVRALHHYDRLKLLSPAHRSERGYRLYCHEDLGRLEKILVLRYLGLSLREIAELLSGAADRGAEALTITLARQLAILRERREGLDRVVRAIEHAQRRGQDDAEPEWHLYQTILKEIQMQETTDWRAKYYSPEAYEVLRTHRAAMTPEQKVNAGARWQALLADVQSALDREVSPDSAEGRSLVARWIRLGEEFTLGNKEILEGYQRMHKDESHWPEDETATMMRAIRPKPEQQAFFDEAVQACLRHG